jgi:branched-chain amino acid transport system ATP-binding protein
MLLTLRSVSAGYNNALALRDVDLDIAAGETVALVGANGAGKSTLLKTISGLIKPVGGTIAFDGQPLDAVPAAQRIARGIAHVPEGREVFGSLTAGENLRLGAYGVRRTVSADQIEARVRDVTTRFPILRERLDRPAAELSGGQQQMLAIGRGLMPAPRLLLLDEPSLGLSPALVDEIFGIIRELQQTGVAVLIAEQNARMALGIAARAYVLENGRIVASGSGADLLKAPEIVERYLGAGAADEVRASPEAAVLTERLNAFFAKGGRANDTEASP